MLPFDPDDDQAHKYQWLMYQLKVWEKLFVQIQRFKTEGNKEKYLKAIALIEAYGYTMSQDWDFDLEKNLNLKAIFDEVRLL